MFKILVFVLIHLSALAYGQSNCDSCKSEFQARNFSKAKALCISASKSGDPICQAYLGIIYMSESDIANAKIWFEKSAGQGNSIGQNGLGYLYQMGLGGLTKDIAKANALFLNSAKQGNSDSQFWLGENLFLSGNKTEGHKWTREAALHGSHDAQYNLALMLQNGEGTKKDAPLAITWFIISATNGNEKSKAVVDKIRQRVSDEQFKIYIKQTESFLQQNPEAIN